MIKVTTTNSREVDIARFYIEAITLLRDRLNVENQIKISGQGDGIGVATSVLELLKKQFPQNIATFESQGNVQDVVDFDQATLTIGFQVTEFEKQADPIYSYIEKYIQQLISFETSKCQDQKKEQIKPEPKKAIQYKEVPNIDERWKEDNNHHKNKRIPKNYQCDELETEGLHGFEDAFGQKQHGRKNNQRNHQQLQKEHQFDDGLVRGEVKRRGDARK